MSSVAVVIEQLGRLRRSTRRLLMLRAGGQVLLALAGGVAAIGLLDYLLRLPGAVRLVLLGGLLIAVAGLVRRHLLPAVRFAPSLVDIALRVEHQRPDLRGRLASAVDFLERGEVDRSPLARLAVARLEPLTAGGFGRRIDPRPTNRTLAGLASVVVVGLITAFAVPGFVGTGVARVLLPFSAAAWPARTAVASLMAEVLPAPGVHPQGELLAVRARNLTAGGEAEVVRAHLRERRGGVVGRWRTITLAHQGDGVHERLIEAGADAVDLWFETADARTSEERIELVVPPAIVQSRLVVEPPAYAEGLVQPVTADLGPGIDERARLGQTVLVGSRARLDVRFTGPIAPPTSAGGRSGDAAVAVGEQVRLGGADGEADPRAAWLAAAFGLAPDAVAVLERTDESQWTLQWTVQETARLEPEPRDRHGLGPREPIRFVIPVATDAIARPAVLEPIRDEQVLADAEVPVRIEAVDDVGLRQLAVSLEVERSGSAAVPLEFGNAFTESLSESFEPTPRREKQVQVSLAAAAIPPAPGDVVLVRAEATDVFATPDGRTVRSEPRRIRIIGEADFGTLLRRDLARVRQEAIRIEAMQSELLSEVRDGDPGPEVARGQAELAERIAAQRAEIASLEERVARNRLDDEPLRQVLRQSSDLLDFAERAAGEALDELERLAEASPASPGAPGAPANEPTDTPPTPEAERAAAAQQEVREELTDLIRLLDRDEDTWLVRRQLERIAAEQETLQERTGDLAEALIGRELEDLTEAERRAIDAVGDEQQALAESFERLVEEMRRRAEAMRETDSAAADGLEAAADQGESRETAPTMEQAAEDARQNRMQEAAARQSQARESLQRMQEALEQASGVRTEELLREIASLRESIERLVELQERELMALSRARTPEDLDERARGMIRLERNTASTGQQARVGGQELRRIARALERAREAQGDAIGRLRAAPPEAEEARLAEEDALERLREALDLVIEAQEQAEEDQVAEAREELVAAYRGLLERQSILRAETLELAELPELGRRERQTARRLGNDQEAVRAALDALRQETEGMADAAVFSYVHEMMDGWAVQVRDRLYDARVDGGVTARQLRIADAIRRQVEALESMQDGTPPEFAEGEAGDGGGDGGGGQGGGSEAILPPTAELMRLKGLQESIYLETRAIDEDRAMPADERAAMIDELGRMQRDVVDLGQRLLEQLVPARPVPIGPPPSESSP